MARDLDVLQEAGVDGVLFCNEKDYPYQLKVGAEIAAAMAATVGRLRERIRVPFGVNLLWDPMASLAVARATGASFIREVLTGVYESDLGIIAPHIGDIAGYRTAIGAADVALFDNISPEFSSPLGTRTRGRSSPGRGVPGHGRDPDQRLGGRQPDGHGRPGRGQGGGSRDADHRQHGRPRGADRGDPQGRRRGDRRARASRSTASPGTPSIPTAPGA